jgi:imidazolonepropionase-like amidohydrolase
MCPAEALWSAAAGGAVPLRSDAIGRVTVGARADLAVPDAPSYLHLAYRPGIPVITQAWLAGRPSDGHYALHPPRALQSRDRPISHQGVMGLTNE